MNLFYSWARLVDRVRPTVPFSYSAGCAKYDDGSFRVNSTNGSQVSDSNIAQKIPKITLVSVMKACQILGCKVLEIQPFKLSVMYCVFALATKMLTFEVSYLHFLHRQRFETCYTD